MNVEFIQAKNGELTAKLNSIFLHSAYSPSNEANRFINNLECNFTPTTIIFCEPGLNYLLKFAKLRFSNCSFGVIRYSSDFNDYNSEYDISISSKDISNNFDNFLLNKLGEEKLCSCLFISWAPTSKVFSEMDNIVWSSIKKATEKSKTLLITREYFEKKWFLNTCKFIKNIKSGYLLKEKISLPVLIIASGPSLKKNLEIIAKYQKYFFIICLSSAISVVKKSDIVPDLCLSTDGGYWAGEHLKTLKKSSLPLALPTEGYSPISVLNNRIIPLFYNDGFSYKLLKQLNFKGIKAERNGTVSGTALDFALSNFTNDIYFLGLDLSSVKGYQHTQPNEIELNNSLKDNRIFSNEKRAAIGSFPSASLKIYEEWFKNKELLNHKVFRVIENDEINNKLGQIKDLSSQEFLEICKLLKQQKNTFNDYFIKTDYNFTNKQILDFITTEIQNENTRKLLFPLDYVSLSHNSLDSTAILQRINTKTEKLLSKIRKLFNEN